MLSTFSSLPSSEHVTHLLPARPLGALQKDFLASVMTSDRYNFHHRREIESGPPSRY